MFLTISLALFRLRRSPSLSHHNSVNFNDAAEIRRLRNELQQCQDEVQRLRQAPMPSRDSNHFGDRTTQNDSMSSSSTNRVRDRPIVVDVDGLQRQLNEYRERERQLIDERNKLENVRFET
jgi:hypothetical protein